MSAMDVPGQGVPGDLNGRDATSRREPQAATQAKAPASAWISWVALAMMTTSSVASLRAAPTMAVYGLACVFLYLLPAVVFLLPTSLVSAELASGWKGGVYNWVALGISKPMGFLAVWWGRRARERRSHHRHPDPRRRARGSSAWCSSVRATSRPRP